MWKIYRFHDLFVGWVIFNYLQRFYEGPKQNAVNNLKCDFLKEIKGKEWPTLSHGVDFIAPRDRASWRRLRRWKFLSSDAMFVC